MMWSCTSPEWICISRATCDRSTASHRTVCERMHETEASVTVIQMCCADPLDLHLVPVSCQLPYDLMMGDMRTWYQFRVDSLCLRYSFSATGWLLWRQVARYSRLALPRYSCFTRS